MIKGEREHWGMFSLQSDFKRHSLNALHSSKSSSNAITEKEIFSCVYLQIGIKYVIEIVYLRQL